MSAKRFSIITIITLVCVLVCLGAVTVVIDPLFHYHSTISGLEYPITNQRYQNDGILRNFTYDSIITGSSMTENFKASEFDALFDASSIKVSFSGSYFKERYDRLRRAFKSNQKIRYVVYSLDSYAILAEKDTISDFSYPDYLYDDSVLNDVQYVFNKSILFDYTLPVISYTLSGNITTDFDIYSNWTESYTFGKESVLERYSRTEKHDTVITLTDEERLQIKENLEQNIISLAMEYPDTEFYLFFPPYSIVCWDERSQWGTLTEELELQEYTMELLMEYSNIHVFSFNDCFDIICDLDNYKDLEHYSGEINSKILEWMKSGEHEITKDNIDQYMEAIEEFYTNYPYDDLFM